MRIKAACGVFLATACLPAASAQDKPDYVQHFCVKAVSGQLPAIGGMLPDLTKMMQVRVDEGSLAWFAALQAVIPAGTSARCDYIFAYGYAGYPPEALGRAQAEAIFKKANIAGTFAELLAKRDRTGTLVSNDLLRVARNGKVGGNSDKGGYVRLNLYKIKPGHSAADWVKLETEGWGPYAAAMAKERAGLGWRAETLVMPSGSGLPYNAITVDLFPNWEATGGSGNSGLWDKVHPDLKSADYMAKVADTADRYKVELYRNVAMVLKK